LKRISLFSNIKKRGFRKIESVKEISLFEARKRLAWRRRIEEGAKPKARMAF